MSDVVNLKPIPLKSGNPEKTSNKKKSVTIHLGCIASQTPMSVRYKDNKSEFVVDMELMGRIYGNGLNIL